jgi:hypothetical protein
MVGIHYTLVVYSNFRCLVYVKVLLASIKKADHFSYSFLYPTEAILTLRCDPEKSYTESQLDNFFTASRE